MLIYLHLNPTHQVHEQKPWHHHKMCWRDTWPRIAPVPFTAPCMTNLLGLKTSLGRALASPAARCFSVADPITCTPFIKDLSSILLQEHCEAVIIISRASHCVLCNIRVHHSQTALFIVPIAFIASCLASVGFRESNKIERKQKWFDYHCGKWWRPSDYYVGTNKHICFVVLIEISYALSVWQVCIP